MSNSNSFNGFIKNLYGKSESVSTCVLGPNQSGKTDFNWLQMERIHDLGIGHRFGSNMTDVKANFPIDFIDDFETLKNTCKMLNPNPKKYGLKKYFFFGSEIGKWAARDRAWENTDLIGELQTVRKYGLSLLTDAIDRVDARVLSPAFFAGQFVKPFKANPKFAVWKNYATQQKITFKDIPKTKIDYDTYETAYFYMKPQIPDDAIVPLNESHKIVKEYRETGSWKKAGVTTQQGKRELFKVLDYHYTHCLPSVHEGPKDKPVLGATSTE